MAITNPERGFQEMLKTTAPVWSAASEDQSGNALASRFLAAFEAVLKHTAYRPFLERAASCRMDCETCAVACPAGNTSARKPCSRTSLLLDIYKQHFTLGGRVTGMILGARSIMDADVYDLAHRSYQCMECGLCGSACSSGVDHGLLARFTRYVLAEAGLAPEVFSARENQRLNGPARNTAGLTPGALSSAIEFMEQTLQEISGRSIPIPVDLAGAEYVFFPPADDFLWSADSIMGMAAMMYATGNAKNWTLSSRICDGSNDGAFFSDRSLERTAGSLLRECERLGASCMVLGEDPHAALAAASAAPLLGGPRAPRITDCVTLACAWHEAGRLPLKRHAISERVTYHDPCALARRRNFTQPPRDLLRTICADFVDMASPGAEIQCCGGGGGLALIHELKDFRMHVTGLNKAGQLRRTGADLVVAPCTLCRKQLEDLVHHHGLNMDVAGLMDLVLKSMDWEMIS